MKKNVSNHKVEEEQDMLPEYDFRGGVRGKHYQEYIKGHRVKIHKADGTTEVRYFTLEDGAVLLAPDVREYFPDSETVNNTLRSLINLIPKERRVKENV